MGELEGGKTRRIGEGGRRGIKEKKDGGRKRAKENKGGRGVDGREGGKMRGKEGWMEGGEGACLCENRQSLSRRFVAVVTIGPRRGGGAEFGCWREGPQQTNNTCLSFFGGEGGVSLVCRQTPAASCLDRHQRRVPGSSEVVGVRGGSLRRAACCCSRAAPQRGKPRANLRDRNPISRGDS